MTVVARALLSTRAMCLAIHFSAAEKKYSLIFDDVAVSRSTLSSAANSYIKLLYCRTEPYAECQKTFDRILNYLLYILIIVAR